jgi:hypothetical protein
VRRAPLPHTPARQFVAERKACDFLDERWEVTERFATEALALWDVGSAGKPQLRDLLRASEAVGDCVGDRLVCLIADRDGAEAAEAERMVQSFLRCAQHRVQSASGNRRAGQQRAALDFVCMATAAARAGRMVVCDALRAEDPTGVLASAIDAALQQSQGQNRQHVRKRELGEGDMASGADSKRLRTSETDIAAAEAVTDTGSDTDSDDERVF